MSNDVQHVWLSVSLHVVAHLPFTSCEIAIWQHGTSVYISFTLFVHFLVAITISQPDSLLAFIQVTCFSCLSTLSMLEGKINDHEKLLITIILL